EADNFLAWASSTRGFVETAGDIMDALVHIPGSLAANHSAIMKAVSGNFGPMHVGFSELERLLDHYMLAKWRRGLPKGDVREPKANVEYVRNLERIAPGAERFYHRLCGIAHPSADSVDYLCKVGDDGLRADFGADKNAIKNVLSEFPSILSSTLQAACNPPLLTLRVLHKFRHHPHLPELKALDWSRIPAWGEIEKRLRTESLGPYTLYQ
ncbi:MAG: hypothetical protein ACYCZX_16435, partial [Rhodospirillaceae bacterium]